MSAHCSFRVGRFCYERLNILPAGKRWWRAVHSKHQLFESSSSLPISHCCHRRRKAQAAGARGPGDEGRDPAEKVRPFSGAVSVNWLGIHETCAQGRRWGDVSLTPLNDRYAQSLILQTPRVDAERVANAASEQPPSTSISLSARSLTCQCNSPMEVVRLVISAMGPCSCLCTSYKQMQHRNKDCSPTFSDVTQRRHVKCEGTCGGGVPGSAPCHFHLTTQLSRFYILSVFTARSAQDILITGVSCQ
jgi:hypothetical protein